MHATRTTYIILIILNRLITVGETPSNKKFLQPPFNSSVVRTTIASIQLNPVHAAIVRRTRRIA